ncbi:MAG: Na(+)/H(+) antiporter subunit B [Clostridia bacterium]|nr:Na(+)/H(+) antiporter subunit B [Clostridia bacterium]
MKKVLALLLLATLAFMTITLVVDNNLLPDFGETKVENSVSDTYIKQNAMGENQDIKFGETKNLEIGSANAITGIVAGYRSFDTLGEVTVLFISALGVSLMIGTTDSWMKRSQSGFILRVGSKAILPILMIVGVYIITHGHLSPGGGFQGGAMIASAMLLLSLSDHEFMPKIKAFKMLEGLSGTIYILIGLVGMILMGHFLQNIDQTGTIGELFSAGLIPVVYLFIGLKVGSELTGIISDFMKKEANI